MRLPFQESMFAFARPSTLRYTTLLVRLTHFVFAALPGLLIGMRSFDVASIGFSQLLVLALAVGTLCVLVSNLFGLYGLDLFSNRLMVRRTWFAWSLAFCLPLLALLPFSGALRMSQYWLATWYLATLAMLWTSRAVMLHFFQRRMRRGKFLRRSVIVGMTDNAILLADYMLECVEAGSGLIGFIDDRQGAHLPGHRLPYLGGMDRLETLVREGRVDQILLALPPSTSSRYEQYVQRLCRMPVQVLLAPDMSLLRAPRQRVAAVSMAGAPMFVIAEPPLQGWALPIKRAEDILLSGLALLALSPLMLLIGLAVKLESPGPVLFRQRRYGYNHRLIEVYKFRSMYHAMRDEHADVQTARHDPRVTRVGRLIRKTSLDELPQLFNVLGGSMSMVGPRPHAKATKAANVLFEDAVEEYVARHRVKPGITGLAQINGYRGETDTLEKIQRRVEYDLHYIEHWSLWLDLVILVRTLPAVLSARAAY